MYLLGLLCLIISATGFKSYCDTRKDSIELLVIAQPIRAINLLKSNQTGLSEIWKRYYLASAYNNNGQYYKSDSIVSLLKNESSYVNDSALYMRVLLLHSVNKKILNGYEDAHAALTDMYEYYARNNNDSGILEVYLSLIEFYRAASNFSFGLMYADKAHALINSMNPKPAPVFMMRMLHRKAAILSEQSLSNDSVIILSNEVIRLGQLYNEPKQVAIASNELGFYLYNQKRQPQLAEAYLKQAYHIWDSLQYNLYIANSSFNLAKLYVELKRYDEAMQLADKILVMVKQNNWIKEEGFWYDLLGKIYFVKKDYERAYDYEHKSKEILTQYAYMQFKDRLAFYSNQLDVKEKEAEVAKAKNELTDKLNENKLLLSLLIAVCILLILAVGGIIIIARQKTIMKKQQQEIFKINEELKGLVSLKDSLLKEINHRVKNNLSMLSSLLYLKEKKVSNIETIDTLREMRSRIQSISLIHETLYQHEAKAKVHFHIYLTQLTDQIKDIYEGMHNSEVEININCIGLWLEISNAVTLAMIINELITNSYKHAFKSVSSPKIKITYIPDSHTLEYADNGPGFESAQSPGEHGTSLVSIFSQQLNANVTTAKNENYYITRINLTHTK